MSLEIGLRYAKYLCRKFSKPLIPIHHMEAHALTARLGENIPFPYMCLLISGGHCQLVIVKGVDKFYLLGESIDDAPGEAFDKIARRLKLQNLPEFDGMSGGRAIEVAASQSEDPTKFDFPLPLARYRDCQFSFAGLKNNAQRLISKLEQENGMFQKIKHKDHINFMKHLQKHVRMKSFPPTENSAGTFWEP